MISLESLIDYLNNLLQPHLFHDYCPNGLQVEGKKTIKKIVTGVSANQALIDAAVNMQADALLAHHGFFWKNESPTIIGMKFRRIHSLISHGINLFAYHLPLDAHPVYGNNAQLGQLLEFEQIESFAVEPGLNIGFLGRLQTPLFGEELADFLATKLSR